MSDQHKVSTHKVKVSQGGRVVIPVDLRKALGLDVGDEVVLRLEDGEIRIAGLCHSIKRAQQMVRHYTKPDQSLVDDLIAERARDVERE